MEMKKEEDFYVQEVKKQNGPLEYVHHAEREELIVVKQRQYFP